nr:Adenosylmethionine-8-amino-7-oxononanoate aminotransferase [Moritella viscosa]SHO11524.1 Adenosylmethionine-8-amino-7-oxononanoate aminotransferase [Moritella viscosa]
MITDITIDGIKEKCFILNNKKTMPLNIKTIDLHLSEKVQFSSIIKTNEEKNLFMKITTTKYGNTNSKLKFFFVKLLQSAYS